MAYGVTALVLVVAVVAVAYGAAAPQLAVAEFAPSAQRALEAPPTTALAETAAGSRSGGRRATSTTVPVASTATTVADAASPASTTRVARTRSCVGTPPRQIEDPMSPPCMTAIFEGDNGGATHTGVSATEIRIGIPNLGPSATGINNRTIDALFELFNQRFELYGRRLVPVYVAGSTSTALGARTVGAEVAAKGVFAATTAYSEWLVGQAALPAELGRRGIVTSVRGGSTWWSDRTLYDEYHPYIWSVYPSSEDKQTNLADFACTTLAGRPARTAGDSDLRAKTRRFAVVVASAENPPQTGVLTTGLGDCTGSNPSRTEWSSLAGTAALDAGLNRVKADGATTVICVCEAHFQGSVAQAAHRVGFHPEWLLTPSYAGTGNDEATVQSFTTSASYQMAPPMRLSAGPRLLPIQARPWFRAIESVLATAGTNVASALSMGDFVYADLLLLASGIQGAGPNLTPDSFAAALMTTTFANPGAGQAPHWQPSAGFGAGDHSLYDDYQVGWWSTGAEALDVGYSQFAQGSWCYLDQGRRFRPGTYPADGESRLFNAGVACR